MINTSLKRMAFAGFLLSFILLQACKSTQNQPIQTVDQRQLQKNEMEYLHYFMEGHRLKTLGYLAEALAVYQKCLGMKPDNATLHYEIATVYLFNNQPSDAFYYAKRAAEIEPANPWMQLLYASMLIQKEDWKEAQKVYENLVENTDKLEYKLDLAELYSLDAKSGKKAIALFTEIEKEVGVNEYLSLNKHKLFKTEGKQQDALDELKKLAFTYPGELKFSLMYVEELVRMNQMKEAENWYQQSLTVHPNQGILSLSYASFLMLNKQPDKAIPFYKTALETPDLDYELKKEALALLFEYYYQPDNQETMIELVEGVNQLHPEESEDKIIRALIYMNQQEWEKAHELVRAQINKAKVSQELMNLALQISLNSGDNERLYQDTKTALDLFPLYANYYVLHGQACLFTKRYQEGIKSLESGLNFAIGDTLLLSDMYNFLGEHYNRMENHAASDEAFEKSIRFNPDNPFTLNNYSYYLALRKVKLEHALELSAKSLEMEPNRVAFLHTYGWINYLLGNYPTAKEYLERAIELSSEEKALFREHLGDIHCKLGNLEKATMNWEKAAALGSESETLNQKMKDKTCLD